MHERGLADEELIDDSERDRFAGVAGPDHSADADRTGDDRADVDRTSADRTSDDRTGDDRIREERFDRSRVTDDVRESDRPRTS